MKAKDSTWQPIDFDAPIYEQEETERRVTAIRDGINKSLQMTRKFPSFMGPTLEGRSLAECVCENYRVLLRRIAELETDIADLLDEEPPSVDAVGQRPENPI